MHNFDFITIPDFKQSLESDYSEMHTCLASSSWKSTQMMSGSIVESLLIDYLIATADPARARRKDPLKMDLADAIATCKEEGVLRDATAELCSVIRSYRNLIHPGRIVRLNEPVPDENSARIAVALVDMIIKEIAVARKSTLGITAEQLVNKVLNDASCLSILSHLITDMPVSQKEKFILELCPSAYMRLDISEDDFEDDRDNRLIQSYRRTLESCSDHTRNKVADEFARIVREENGDYIEKFAKAFFRAPDIGFATDRHKSIIKAKILGTHLLNDHESLRLVEGLEKFISVTDVPRWIDSYVRTISLKETFYTKKARKQLLDALVFTSVEINDAVTERIEHHINGYSKRQPDKAKLLKELKSETDAVTLPF